MLAALLVSSAFAAAPALAANMDGVARGPAKDMSGTMAPMPGMAGGAGASTASGNTVVRSTDKSADAEESRLDAMHTGSIRAGESHLENWNVRSVQIVNVHDQAAAGHGGAESVATDITPQDRRELWSSLEANPYVRAQLRANSVTASSVVAANYDGNGTITVYVN